MAIWGGDCLKDVDVDVPAAVSLGDTVALRCSFDLEGESLYTVKWYQGKKEFFRYVPKELPPTKVFPLPGVNVDVSASGAHQVVLTDVQLSMSGRYRCEVSADAPSFHTEMVAKVMNVVDYPEGKPSLKVEKRRYGVGDTLRANCTAPASSPAANLTWLLNGRYLNESLVRRYQSKELEASKSDYPDPSASPGEEWSPGKAPPPTGKVTWTSYLEADVEGSSFVDGRLHLRCVATLFAVWSDSAETVLEEERPRLASVLGTRESSHGHGGALRRRGELWVLPLAALSSLVLGRR
ncbi:uncharacterized protein LOC124173952 [Ischnura elegans]|uniref:uncharacterized protein LOC124173952 n=1 Tax=Ischnura elegans TaxID=197161 RepID=UPI001ED8B17D|nr:uncharacterized protein LOC124173952 [Ischnura elegans]